MTTDPKDTPATSGREKNCTACYGQGKVRDCDQVSSRIVCCPVCYGRGTILEDASTREDEEMVETLTEGTSQRLDATSSTTSGSADQAVSHAKEEVRYCYEELHGRKPLEVGHGGHLTYGDLEVIIQAAEKAAELQEKFDKLHDFASNNVTELEMQNQSLREHLRIEEIECQKQCAEKEALRDGLRILATFPIESNSNHQAIEMQSIAREALNKTSKSVINKVGE